MKIPFSFSFTDEGKLREFISGRSNLKKKKLTKGISLNRKLAIKKRKKKTLEHQEGRKNVASKNISKYNRPTSLEFSE